MTTIYILQLEKGKYYIGKSENVMNRYNQHINGYGSAWTKKYKPLSIVKTIVNSSSFDEDKITKEYMSAYGIDNVRGGSYVEIELSEFQKDAIKMEIWGAKDLCKKCGRTGHFIKDCYSNKDIYGNKIELDDEHSNEDEWGCEFCDRTFTTKFGCIIHEKSCKYKKKNNIEKQNGNCYRCGRAGHYSPECYASRHIKGYEL
jgi:hypothetical protein